LPKKCIFQVIYKKSYSNAGTDLAHGCGYSYTRFFI